MTQTFICSFKIIENLRTDVRWQLVQMCSTIVRSQGNNIVSATQEIVETHISERKY